MGLEPEVGQFSFSCKAIKVGKKAFMEKIKMNDE